MATESGVINSSIKTLGINDTVDSETSAKNSEGLENYGEQQEQTVVLNENGKGQSQDFGQTPQVHLYGTTLHIYMLNSKVYCSH